MTKKTSGPSQRQLRVAEQIRHALVDTLQRGTFKEPALIDSAPLVTVAEVRTTSDFRGATAYIMPLGEHNIEEILTALNKSAYYFQKEINRTSSLKFTPRITFKMDETFGEAAKIEDILKSIPKYIDHEEDDETASDSE
jgi:ribosome-binding factor A